jgi:hypothetical protein
MPLLLEKLETHGSTTVSIPGTPMTAISMSTYKNGKPKNHFQSQSNLAHTLKNLNDDDFDAFMMNFENQVENSEDIVLPECVVEALSLIRKAEEEKKLMEEQIIIDKQAQLLVERKMKAAAREKEIEGIREQVRNEHAARQLEIENQKQSSERRLQIYKLMADIEKLERMRLRHVDLDIPDEEELKYELAKLEAEDKRLREDQVNSRLQPHPKISKIAEKSECDHNNILSDNDDYISDTNIIYDCDLYDDEEDDEAWRTLLTSTCDITERKGLSAQEHHYDGECLSDSSGISGSELYDDDDEDDETWRALLTDTLYECEKSTTANKNQDQDGETEKHESDNLADVKIPAGSATVNTCSNDIIFDSSVKKAKDSDDIAGQTQDSENLMSDTNVNVLPNEQDAPVIKIDSEGEIVRDRNAYRSSGERSDEQVLGNSSVTEVEPSSGVNERNENAINIKVSSNICTGINDDVDSAEDIEKLRLSMMTKLCLNSEQSSDKVNMENHSANVEDCDDTTETITVRM